MCIKDMAGLIDPHTTFELVTSLKKAVNVPIHLHTHDSCGLGMMSALKAVEAGCECSTPFLVRLRGTRPSVHRVTGLRFAPFRL